MAEFPSLLSSPFLHYSSCPDISDNSQVVIGVFFGIAIFAAAARVTIRLWLQMRLRLDDYLLLSSCLYLTAATSVLYYGTPSIFFGAELSFDPAAVLPGWRH